MRSAGTDRRARLEEDRDFLLSSIDDLELEYAAGDIDETDYRALNADYVGRAAHVLRALADDQRTVAPGPAAAVGATLGWIAGVVVVAAVAGVLLAQFAGSRTMGESITGNIRLTSRQMLFDAQQAFAEGDPDRALAIYDDVVEIQPANVEALTYRGWLTSRTGDPADAIADLDDAIAIDPDYPDARLFRAIVALDLEDPETAAAELAAFDTLDPPAFAAQLVTNAQIRERVAFGRVTNILLVDDPPSFAESGLTVADISGAAEILAADGDLLEAVQLFDTVLREDDENVEALTYRGWLIARAGDAQLLDAGLELLDQALELDPSYAPALVFRAFASNESGDLAAAKADLVAFDSLAVQPRDLVLLIDEFGLRQSVEAG